GEAREAREGAPGGRSRGEGEAWSSAPLTGYRALRTGWLRAEFQQVRRGRSGREPSRGAGEARGWEARERPEARAAQAPEKRDDGHAWRRRCPPEALTPLHFRDLSSNS